MPRIVVSCGHVYKDTPFAFSTTVGEYGVHEVDRETLLRLQRAKAEWDWMQDLLKELWNR